MNSKTNPNTCYICNNVNMVVVIQQFDANMVRMPTPQYSVAGCPFCNIDPKPANRDQGMSGVVAAGWLPILKKIGWLSTPDAAGWAKIMNKASKQEAVKQ